MVFTVKLKHITFKQDLSSITLMLDNQAATYAVLRYCYDIPTKTYEAAMTELTMYLDDIYNTKLHNLILAYSKAKKVGLQDWEEEFVETLEFDLNSLLGDKVGPSLYDIDDITF